MTTETTITPLSKDYESVSIEYTCTVCGSACDKVKKVPGFLTLYREDCAKEVERTNSAERQKTFRARHKGDPKYKKANAERQAAYRKARAADPEYKAKEAARKRAARAAKKTE